MLRIAKTEYMSNEGGLMEIKQNAYLFLKSEINN